MKDVTSVAANIRGLTLAIAIAFLATSVGVGYWSLVASAELSTDPFNPRLVAAVRDRPRGSILDTTGGVLADSVKTANGYVRHYAAPSLEEVSSGHTVGCHLFGPGSKVPATPVAA